MNDAASAALAALDLAIANRDGAALLDAYKGAREAGLGRYLSTTLFAAAQTVARDAADLPPFRVARAWNSAAHEVGGLRANVARFAA